MTLALAENPVLDDLGTYVRDGDLVTLHYERRYPRPIETVWAALTTPERLADWIGASVVEPRVGGTFNVFADRDEDGQTRGKVITWQPPKLLEFTWHFGDTATSKVRCELKADGPGTTRLIFTHSGIQYPWAGLVLPGWHACFERLAALMASGKPVPASTERWSALQAIYLDHYKLEGVMTERTQTCGPKS